MDLQTILTFTIAFFVFAASPGPDTTRSTDTRRLSKQAGSNAGQVRENSASPGLVGAPLQVRTA